MALDLQNQFDSIKSDIAAKSKVNKLKKDIRKLERDAGDSLSEKKEGFTQTLESKVGDIKNKFSNSEIKSSYDNLVNILKEPDTGVESVDEILSYMLDAARDTISQVPSILSNQIIKSLGCDQEQEFVPDESLYVKVQSIDVMDMLKYPTDEKKYKALYEDTEIDVQSFPFSMNRELNHRLSQGVSFENEYSVPYKGASTQPLMDIKYVTTDGDGNFGDFFKIDLKNRNESNRIIDFCMDYYQSIEIINTKNLFTNIMNQISGVVDFNMDFGSGKQADVSRAMKLLTRILGLCFDTTQEIDVAGTAKVSILEELDDGFFELSEPELRSVDEEVNNIKNGVIEFEGCDGIKLPVDMEEVTKKINQIWENPSSKSDSELQEELIKQIEDLSQNPEWNVLLPNINFNLTLKFSIIAELPKIFIRSLLTPKILLPILIAYKSLKQDFVDRIEDFTSLLRELRNVLVNSFAEIQAIFIEKLMDLIKSNLTALVSQIAADIAKETKNAKLRIILKLLSFAFLLVNLIRDYKRCRSIVDELLAILRLLAPKINIPLLPLSFAPLSEGFSPTRAMTNVIDSFDKAGLPTGDLPDGSPNLMLISIFKQIESVKKEDDENGKIQLSTVQLGGNSDPFMKVVGGAVLPQVLSGKKL